MTVENVKYTTSEKNVIKVTLDGIVSFVPVNTENRDYQKILDAIIENQSNVFDGDELTELKTAAVAKQKEYYESIIERNKSITFEKVLQINTDDRDGSEVKNWVISEKEKEWELLVEKAKNYIEANS